MGTVTDDTMLKTSEIHTYKAVLGDALTAVILTGKPTQSDINTVARYCEDRHWPTVLADIMNCVGSGGPPFAPGAMYFLRSYYKWLGWSLKPFGGDYRERVRCRCASIWGRRYRREVINLLTHIMLGDTQAVRRCIASAKSCRFTDAEIEFVTADHGYEGVDHTIIRWCKNPDIAAIKRGPRKPLSNGYAEPPNVPDEPPNVPADDNGPEGSPECQVGYEPADIWISPMPSDADIDSIMAEFACQLPEDDQDLLGGYF